MSSIRKKPGPKTNKFTPNPDRWDATLTVPAALAAKTIAELEAERIWVTYKRTGKSFTLMLKGRITTKARSIINGFA